jgi:hypothetical protein
MNPLSRAVLVALATLATHTASAQQRSAPKSDVPVAPMPVATLERTGCLGTCPAYRVEVFDDGRVAYRGRAFVKLAGDASGNLAPTDLARLRSAFDAAGLAAMDASAGAAAIDGPSTVLAFRTAGGMHEVGVAEPALERLASEFERIVGIQKWIGTEKERAALPDADAEAERIALLAANAGPPSAATPRAGTPPLPVAQVRLGALRASWPGSNAAAVVSSTLLPHVRHCYQRGLEDEPKQAGLLTVRMKVSPGGDVSAADIDVNGKPTMSAPVVACVAATAQRLRFAAPKSEATAVVTLTLEAHR